MGRKQACYVGRNRLAFREPDIRGEFVRLGKEDYYVIRGFQDMDPFLMSVVSGSDHWMFVSSNGALTAGRRNPEIALFPYCTVDKIHDSVDITGPKTIILLDRKRKRFLWEPFAQRMWGIYNLSCNLYKNITGNKVIFEEINHDLLMSFSYQWSNGEELGFIRKSVLTNLSEEAVQVELLDGIQNILPQGVDRMMQSDKSCLVDAYKKCELFASTGLGIYRLSSIPVDRAEPSESLKANTVWSHGPSIGKILLSTVQLDRFRRGQAVSQEHNAVGKRGAYLVNIETSLPPRTTHCWHLVGDVNQTAAKVAHLNRLLSSPTDLVSKIEADVEAGTRSLLKIVASSDGLQWTADRLSTSRHFANVLFNVMRGGIFDDGYIVSKGDLTEFAGRVSIPVLRQNREFFEALPETIRHGELLQKAWAAGDTGVIRTCMTYMPLTFSRRHGDPSRPWNLFDIKTRDEAGHKILNYQGNWRDIFQNWEALALSFPGYVESMIAKFLNASTADGYNPYRVTRDGFDWEVQDPHDPWSFIGYWGDHQTIYLLKLLEVSEHYHPGRLQQLLKSEIFSYANVPYRMRDYRSLLMDPHHSIDYDKELESTIGVRVKKCGVDGKLVWDKAGHVYSVNLTEKLLVSILSRLSNFVPEGGIWMNTQRPEWNDANNALAGYGLSMVTLCYLRRYIAFCRQLFTDSTLSAISVSQEVADLLSNIHGILDRHKSVLIPGFDDKVRGAVLAALGEAGTAYRARLYSLGFSELRVNISIPRLLDFLSTALQYLDRSIQANRRPDALYHAYNLLSVQENGAVAISHLYAMLEGQVAVLSSGCLTATESVAVLEALRKSDMFREDQYSYTLYPARVLPSFIERNNIPAEFARISALLNALVADGNTLLAEKDVNGVLHFNGSLTNRNVLSQTLDALSGLGYGELVDRERQSILDTYEAMFLHKTFTGRSGTFYSYEGLGSIYWHMVSKLLLAVEETLASAVEKGESPETINTLREIYFDVRKGLGVHKSPALYGAFPTDPYSHTPAHSGAQQPGMTGQVKEDIITRFRELGLTVSGGRIQFELSLLNRDEFLSEPGLFRYFDVSGAEQVLPLAPGMLAYTFCQVPVILKRGGRNVVSLTYGVDSRTVPGLQIGLKESRSIFERDGKIRMIEVELDL